MTQNPSPDVRFALGLTLAQVAALLNLPPDSVRHATQTGQLRSRLTPAGPVYRPADVERYAESRAAPRRVPVVDESLDDDGDSSLDRTSAVVPPPRTPAFADDHPTTERKTAMSKNHHEVAFASAAPTSSGEELLSKLLAFRPIETRITDTRLGQAEATIADVVEVTDGGEAIPLGPRPIFWQVVRAQLAKASPQVPWIAGRLVKSGQAYRLESLTDADADLVGAALLATAK